MAQGVRRKRKEAVHKNEIDKKIAIAFDYTLEETSAMTSAFLHEIMEQVLQEKEVQLEGFGTFHLVVRTGKRLTTALLRRGTFKRNESTATTMVAVKRKFHVCFRKAYSMRQVIQERFGGEMVLKSMEDCEDQVHRR